MKRLLGFILLFATITTYAQVGIGVAIPDASAQLDVFATDKGVLIPRLQLKNSTDFTTISNGNVESLLVYNTAKVADLIPGYYYWNGVKWVRFSTADETTVSISKFIDNNNGTLTHIGGDGTATTFNVLITAPGPPLGSGAPGNVFVNESTGDFYTWDAQSEIWKNLSSDTITTLENHNDGTYTYTSENGTSTIIDARSLKITDNTNGTYTVTNRDGSTSTINTHAASNPVADATIDVDGDGIADNGVTVQSAVQALAAKSAIVSKLVDNADGTYTYTDETGKTTRFKVTRTGLGSPTVGGEAGDIYVNELTGNLYAHNGTAWVNQNAMVFAGLDTNADGLNDTRYLTTLSDGSTLRNTADFAITDTGEIGLGTNSPDNKLHVVATANPLKIEGLNQGEAQDMRLSIDANGVVKQVAANVAVLRTKTEDYTAMATDETILVDASKGGVTINLPVPVLGKKIMLKKIDDSPNPMVISGAGATIDGRPSRTSTMAYQRFILQSDGVNWFVMAD